MLQLRKLMRSGVNAITIHARANQVSRNSELVSCVVGTEPAGLCGSHNNFTGSLKAPSWKGLIGSDPVSA